MPVYDLNQPTIPAPAVVSDDEIKIATLERGELLALRRPEGEGWVSARLRFDAIGARLGFTLKLWWATTGERWYVIRMR